MADLGLHFGEDENDTKIGQEDKDLSYLVLAGDQEDPSYEVVDTETLLNEMAEDFKNGTTSELEVNVGTDVLNLFTDPNLSPTEKVRVLAKSDYDFHRAFLARELLTMLPSMDLKDAIETVIPVMRDFSMDPQESVRESLAAQLDKLVLFFFQHAPISFEEVVETTETTETTDKAATQNSQEASNSSNNTSHISRPLSIQHDIFTPIFMNLLLDQNAQIAHQTREAVKFVSENVPESLLESEIIHGIIAGLERLYSSSLPPLSEDSQDPASTTAAAAAHAETDMEVDQDGEAELGKMLVVVLLTSLANVLGKQRCTNVVLPKLQRLVNSSQFYIRKELVIALGTLCKVVDQQVVIERLLPLYDAFVRDESWHIRRACCTVLASFVSSLPVEMKTEKVEEIYEFYSTDASRGVRHSIMEVLGEVIAGFQQDHVPDSLLNHFLNMGQQPMNEHELAVMCAFSFPAVILTAGRSKWEQMKPVYMKLAGTFRSPIRRSLACSLHEVARILGPELADRDLAMAFSDCLLAEDEVKEGVIGHVVDFISCLSPKCRSEALRDMYNAWSELERSSNWRLRDSLAGQLPALCEIADGNDLLEYLMPLSIRACTDGVSMIRESGVMSFPALWEASARVGSFVYVKSSPAARRFSLSDDEGEGLVLGSFGEGEDIDMEDVTHQLKDSAEGADKSKSEESGLPNGASSPSTPAAASKEAATTEATAAATTTATTTATTPSPSSSTASAATSTTTILSADDSETGKPTTIKEHVIRQTIEFATSGGFRTRVVAVQIIQSLLDCGISDEEFQDHFLSLLVDQLATDAVVNVRISASRVVSWIIESGLYADESINSRLQGALLVLQKDSDRDVRLYSGGPSELPKPKKKKKKSKKTKKVTKNNKDGSHPEQDQASSSSSSLTTDQTEGKGEPIQFPKGEGESAEEEEEEEEEDDDDDEEEDDDDDEEDDSDEESSGDDMGFLSPAKSKGICNKPGNRNSIGIGMKVMVGNKLTVSGKEIRKPKTSWDYIHGEIDEEDEEGAENTYKTFAAALEAIKARRKWNGDGDDDDVDDDDKDGEVSLFDAPRAPLDDDDLDICGDVIEDLVNGQLDRDGDKVVPYFSSGASSGTAADPSPSDADMQEDSGEDVTIVVSGNGDAALAGQESESQSIPQVPIISMQPPSPSPTTTTFADAPSSKTPPGSGSSKKDGSKKGSRGVGSISVSAASTASSPAVATGRNGTTNGRSPEEEVLRVLNAKIGAGKRAHNLALPPPISIAPATNKKALGSKEPGSPSYAAIVASGASSPHPGVVPVAPQPRFSPPVPPMTTSSTSKFGSS